MHLNHPRLLVPTATIATAAAAFAVLADSASEGDGPASLDPSITTDVVHHRTSALTSAAHALTFLGSELVVSILALGVVILLLERRGPRHAVLATLAMAVSAFLTVGIKLAVGRARPGPTDRLGPFDTTYSFPSGHTLNSAVLIGLLCLLVVPLVGQRGLRAAAYGGALVLAVGIGASRVYLGYHWTTDVLASWTIAAALLAIVHLVDRALPPRQSGTSQVDRATVRT